MNNLAQTPPGDSPGGWLTRQIERRSMTVRQFADAMEVTTQTVYAWQGDRGAISEERVPRLADVLGITQIEARRGLGYWVPVEQNGSKPTVDKEELERIKADILAILERISRLQE